MSELPIIEYGSWKCWIPCNYFNPKYNTKHPCGYWLPTWTFVLGGVNERT